MVRGARNFGRLAAAVALVVILVGEVTVTGQTAHDGPAAPGASTEPSHVSFGPLATFGTSSRSGTLLPIPAARGPAPSLLAVNQTTITVWVPNGACSYTPATTDLNCRGVGGTFAVDGSALTVTVGLAPVAFDLTFTESGLPTGTNWWVVLNGTAHNSTGTSLTLLETNGTYLFAVGGVAGYAATPSSGHIAINGEAAALAVTFAPTHSGSLLGLPTTGAYAVIGGIVTLAVIAVATAILVGRGRWKATAAPPSGPPPPNDPPGSA